ncbi:MAG TPA: hypothetical protein VFY93_10390 [Planctomycetota bacterium]|nr:hypothetical protein [Planctomycetota bacterium]
MRRDATRADGSRPLPVPDEETLRRFCLGEDGEERLCLHCRNPFDPTRVSRKGDALYCRPRCKRAAENARYREHRTTYKRRWRKRRIA